MRSQEKVVGTKTCSTCRSTKPLAEFGVRATSPDGLHGFCRACARTYNAQYRADVLGMPPRPKRAVEERAEHRREVRRPYLARKNAEHKARINVVRANPCRDCGQNFPPAVMEFDHVRGEKRSGIGTMTSHAAATVYAELEKCEVVCSNCHRIRTAARRPEPKSPSHTLPRWQQNKAHRQQRKIAAYRQRLAVLKNRPCLDCTNIFPAPAMDFDHNPSNGKKRFSLSNGWTRPWEEVECELAKCDLVCANCHRMRTESRARPQRKAA